MSCLYRAKEKASVARVILANASFCFLALDIVEVDTNIAMT